VRLRVMGDNGRVLPTGDWRHLQGAQYLQGLAYARKPRRVTADGSSRPATWASLTNAATPPSWAQQGPDHQWCRQRIPGCPRGYINDTPGVAESALRARRIQTLAK
jgi:hypothetical protein